MKPRHEGANALEKINFKCGRATNGRGQHTGGADRTHARSDCAARDLNSRCRQVFGSIRTPLSWAVMARPRASM
jgi:hypothetical protein